MTVQEFGICAGHQAYWLKWSGLTWNNCMGSPSASISIGWLICLTEIFTHYMDS